jgi:phosphate/sulfate permease
MKLERSDARADFEVLGQPSIPPDPREEPLDDRTPRVNSEADLICAVLLFSQRHLGGNFYVPFWVVVTCQAAMALGTSVGGWRIVRTVGSEITRMTPVQGCCASAGGAVMLFAATFLGIPVSTTHTVTGAIIGVGAARKHRRCVGT